MQPTPTARLIPAGRLFRADGVISVPILVESSRTQLALPINPTTAVGRARIPTLRYREFPDAGDAPIPDLNPGDGGAPPTASELTRQPATREHSCRLMSPRDPLAPDIGARRRREK